MATIIHRDPEIWGGAPVFRGTRFPIRFFFEWLEDGHSIAEFLDTYPSVEPQHIHALLSEAMRALDVPRGDPPPRACAISVDP